MRASRLVSATIGLALALAACSSGSDGSVSVDDAWGRTSPAAATNAAFYMAIEGGAEADTLVSATSAVCGLAELHISVLTDGVMTMQHLPDGIDVPAGETVMLEPGSYHVMCIDRQREFAAGDSIPVTLEFAGAGTVAIEAEIRDE
jgi:copper(I)-binding protein